MQEIYSVLLLHSAKLPITEENVKKVLEAIGANIDEGKIRAVVASLEGKNIDELLKQATFTPTTEEKKKEEKKEEKKTEEAVAGLSALFG